MEKRHNKKTNKIILAFYSVVSVISCSIQRYKCMDKTFQSTIFNWAHCSCFSFYFCVHLQIKRNFISWRKGLRKSNESGRKHILTALIDISPLFSFSFSDSLCQRQMSLIDRVFQINRLQLKLWKGNWFWSKVVRSNRAQVFIEILNWELGNCRYSFMSQKFTCWTANDRLETSSMF